MDDEEYEAQRQANIAANLALLQSLGLERKVKIRKPRPISNKPKSTDPKGPGPFDRQLRSSSAISSASSSPSVSPTKEQQQTSYFRVKKRVFYGRKSPDGSPLKKRKSTRIIHPRQFIVDDSSSANDEEDYDSSRLRTNKYGLEYVPMRNAARLGERIHNPKQFGHIPGVPVGTWWQTRMECSTDAVHAPPVSGICGNIEDGCYSLALSGGYADDVDLGHEFTYTGSGGKKLSGLVNGKFLNLRTAPQTYDQSFEDTFNAALRTSSKTRKPIRVIRGYKLDSPWAPLEGYLYCGLYVCTRAWMGDGLSGHKVCKYAFKRLPNQDPLPIPDREGESEEQVTDDTSVEEDGLEKNRKSHSLQYQSKGLIVEVVINTTGDFSPYNSLSSVSPLK